MSGLPGLRAALEAASGGDWTANGVHLRISNPPYRFTTMCHSEANARLIALAPAMAQALIDCEEALRAMWADHEHSHNCSLIPEDSDYCVCGLNEAEAVLARLADLDRSIT